MVVPVVSDTVRDIVSVVLSQEHGNLLPVLVFATGAGTAARLALSAAHATCWYLHGHDDEHDVEDGALAEPEGQVRTHGVVREVVDQNFERNKDHVHIEHVPVEPAPLCRVFGAFLLGFVDYDPLEELVGDVEDPG